MKLVGFYSVIEFVKIPRRRLAPAGFCGARFAPRSSQSLAAPFRGAKYSHRFRAAACPRPAFAGCDLLPAPRKALQLRSGEQNLHTDSAPPPASGRLLRGAICSPLLAKPCGSVPGRKIFTQILRRRLPPAGFCGARFAPRSSQSLAAPFRGAKSSHRFRAAACPWPRSRIKKRRTLFLFLVIDGLRHPLHNLLIESIQGIPDGLEEVRGTAGVVPVPGGH